jgi:hypothetical protein
MAKPLGEREAVERERQARGLPPVPVPRAPPEPAHAHVNGWPVFRKL